MTVCFYLFQWMFINILGDERVKEEKWTTQLGNVLFSSILEVKFDLPEY